MNILDSQESTREANQKFIEMPTLVAENFLKLLWGQHHQHFESMDDNDLSNLRIDIQIQSQRADTRETFLKVLMVFFSHALMIDPQKTLRVYGFLLKDEAKLFCPIRLAAEVLIEKGPEFDFPKEQIPLTDFMKNLKCMAREDEIVRRTVSLVLIVAMKIK